jgi:cytochrome c peroxidase
MLSVVSATASACSDLEPAHRAITDPTPTVISDDLDSQLRGHLAGHGFTGRMATTLETRLGRRIDNQLANVGRLLWFDPIQGLNDDNACAGCHSPTAGFGDTQPIAIGIDNNGVVGPGRTGPRNQRRTPMAINTAFYPTLMWNSRFNAPSGDPFDNSQGFVFPAPEGTTLSYQPHLLTAQAFIPPTERVEAAGFHFPGNSDDIRNEVVRRLNADPNYRQLFSRVFPGVKAGAAITFDHVARAIAEFEFTLVFADAPIDRYARGVHNALTTEEKQGAVLFFGRAGCVNCHKVSGQSNEMFSDFRQHVAGIPQVFPLFSNMRYDGPGENEDFGLEQSREWHRILPHFPSQALQPAFMHNGAFTQLADAIRYHLDAVSGAATFTPSALPADMQGPMGPLQAVLDRLDPLLTEPVQLTEEEFSSLVAFVRNGLLDPAADAQKLRRMIPENLPSGRPKMTFQ